MEKKIGIIIVDDHAIFREGLKSVLSQQKRINVLSELGSGKDLLRDLGKSKPDIVLIDILMPEMDGVVTTEKALEMYPSIKFIALSSYTDHAYYYMMIKAGVQGFVSKKTGLSELLDAIYAVNDGRNYFPQDTLHKLLYKISHSEKNSFNISTEISLTKRESEILYLICKGFTNNEIAKKLCISPKTVDNHRTNLLSKTSTKNSAHLVAFAMKNYLVDI